MCKRRLEVRVSAYNLPVSVAGLSSAEMLPKLDAAAKSKALALLTVGCWAKIDVPDFGIDEASCVQFKFSNNYDRTMILYMS